MSSLLNHHISLKLGDVKAFEPPHVITLGEMLSLLATIDLKIGDVKALEPPYVIKLGMSSLLNHHIS